MAAYVPAALALAAILAVGLLAERQTRELSRQAERAEAAVQLERLRAGLDGAIGNQLRLLSGFAGALAATPGMGPAEVEPVAAALTRRSAAVRALAVVPPSGSITVHAAREGETPALDAMLAAAAPRETGSRWLPMTGKQALALWMPVPAAADGPPAGQAVAVVDAEALFAEAGLRDPRLGLDLTLAAAEAGAPEGDRALYLGHPAVLEGDPVSVAVALPGGEWQLAAVPLGGWSHDAGTGWRFRVLTLLSAGLIAWPMLRTRRLGEERRRQAKALRDREVQLATLSRRLALALDVSRVGVWDYDIDADVLVWDDRMDELYGMPDDGAPRTYLDWRGRLHPEDLNRAEGELLEAIRDTGRYSSDFRVRLPDGAERHIRAIGALYREPDGPAKMVGVNWDVTGDVQREGELEARRREAEVASHAKSQFLATVSHEIRTPMNGLAGMLELLLRTDLDGEQCERALIARNSAQHLLAILDDLLDLSRIEANRIVLAPAEVDVARMARDVVVLLSAGIEGHDLRLFTSFDGPVPATVVCDPKRLRQVLLNLVGNAVKFTQTGSVELRLGHDEAEQRLQVEVRDTGVGIADDARGGLFERFTQVDTPTTRERGGTGLGLAICKELVALMGGEICVDSVPGLGSTFRFWIPAPAGVSVDSAAEVPEPPEAPAMRSAHGGQSRRPA